MSPMKKKKRSREADEGGAEEPDKKKRAIEQQTSMFDKKPKVGMRLDARDVDYIWSQATVVKVHKQTKIVTVRFDGWDKNYDETMEWSNERLAPLHSFTKMVKCLVDLLPKKRGKPTASELDAPQVYCNLWPCKVQFRMPQPGDNEDCVNAQAFLRAETSIFVQPYETHLLPFRTKQSLRENDGKWLKAKRVRPWKANPTELGVLPENFDKCFRLAKKDKETVGVLPGGAIEEGSLLKEEYQVHSQGGAKVRDGALHKEGALEREKEEGLLKSAAVAVKSVLPQPKEKKKQKSNGESKEEEESSQTSCVIS